MSAHSTATVVEWLGRIFKHEGVYSSRESDPGNWTGGKIGVGDCNGTKYGISAAAYPELDIENLTQEDAADIYIADYLAPIKAHHFEDGVAYQMLDFAVHSGPGTAKRQLQEAIGVTADGHIGPVSLAAMGQYSEAGLIMILLSKRLNYLTRLYNWTTESRGWARRISHNLRIGVNDI